MIDLVCGMEVDPEQTKICETYKERVFFFCDNACRKVFWMDPERYFLEEVGRMREGGRDVEEMD